MTRESFVLYEPFLSVSPNKAATSTALSPVAGIAPPLSCTELMLRIPGDPYAAHQGTRAVMVASVLVPGESGTDPPRDNCKAPGGLGLLVKAQPAGSAFPRAA